MPSKSEQLFEISKQLFPGGVNSPVRAFKSVGGTPLFFESASGAYLHDVDKNKYVDYIGSWGPMICGHKHPQVIKGIKEMCDKALSFGACHEYEILLARAVQTLMPNIEMLRFVSSGTEACMSAIRLARAFTRKNKIIKFSGCYHGHFDSFLVQAGSGAATFGLPDSPGVVKDLASQTLTAEFNDIQSVINIFNSHPEGIAAVIVEPVVGNAGCILPEAGFLQNLRSICSEYQTLLVFDEVMTGFRVSKGGAQELYDIKPDLTTLGKIIGGGLPVGAYGGKKEIMELIAPSGPVYQAGTLSGNPLGMIAGATTLSLLSEKGFYDNLEDYGKNLEKGIREIAFKKGVPIVLNRCGSMLSVFFTQEPRVINYKQAKKSNTEFFAKFYHSMLKQGVYLPPSQFEAWFFSAKHGDKELEITLKAFEKSL
ncbi:MAG: glutamate-1-semialdehyde 2,1-aminomutase [Candidatus Caenarcaniphilales bacterium]|nr:glutamate-1-semialdehyde 2,1-aminomutase [Candidatus Caenarcaniphilales bacterium]